MGNLSIKTRILLTICVIGIPTLIGGIFLLRSWRTQELRTDVRNRIISVSELVDVEITDYGEIMFAALEVLELDKGIQQACIHKDREELHRLIEGIYNVLHERHRIEGLTLYDNTGTPLVTFGQTEGVCGNHLSYSTVKTAIHLGTQTRGLEVSEGGCLFLHMAEPWVLDGKLIGYLEIDLAFKPALLALNDVADVKTMTIVDKSSVHKNQWTKGFGQLGGLCRWDTFEDHAVVGWTGGELPDAVISLISKQREAFLGPDPALIGLTNNLGIGVIPLNEASGRQFGSILIFQDLTHKWTAVRTLIYNAAAGLIFAGLVLLLILNYTIGHIEHQIEEANKRREEEAKAREALQQQHILAINTERAALAESELRYRMLVEYMDIGVALVSKDCTVQLVNSTLAKLADCAPDRLVGRKCYETFNRQHSSCDECPGMLAIQSNRLEEEVETITLENGKTMTLRVRAYPMPGPNGQPTGFVELVEDITQRIEHEEILRVSEERHRAISETALDAIITTDKEGRVLFWNASAKKIFGYSEDEIVGKSLIDTIVPAFYHEAKQRGIAAFQQQRGSASAIGKTLELAALRKGGEEFPIEISLSGYEGQNGHMTVAFIRDITERKQAELQLRDSHQQMAQSLQREKQVSVELEATMQQLRAATKEAEAAAQAKSEFLANMSHEIRTPLTAILGYADVLEENDLDTNSAEAVEIIRRNGKHLLALINDILDLSKIEAGKLSIERLTFSPTKLTMEIVTLMRGRAQDKGLDLTAEFEGEIPEQVLSDPTRLRQILINLLGNAIKFTEIGGVRIVVRMASSSNAASTSDSDLLQFEVVDSGIGMTQEQVSHLFQPFTQADTSTTRRFGGSGLGLIISRRLARILGGDISVQTEQGRGSQFTVTINPGDLTKVAMIQPDATNNDTPDITNPATDRQPDSIPLPCRILLAEDGPDNQRLISFMLKKAGADVTVAENGAIAVEVYERARNKGTPFDLVLMDIQMPVMDGYDATIALRKGGSQIPIIALTAHALPEHREQCLASGCTDFLTKPIGKPKLLAALHHHLREAQQRT